VLLNSRMAVVFSRETTAMKWAPESGRF
jgi:hypothetical protein